MPDDAVTRDYVNAVVAASSQLDELHQLREEVNKLREAVRGAPQPMLQAPTPSPTIVTTDYPRDAYSWPYFLPMSPTTLAGGPFLPVSGGNISGNLSVTGGLTVQGTTTAVGPLQWIATGSNTMRSAQNRSADYVNALDYGAVSSGNGAVDNAPAINAALATGRPVYLPAGLYRVLTRITMASGTALYGDGRGFTRIWVGGNFDPTANSVIYLSGAEDQSPIIRDLEIMFDQPGDTVTTATAASAPGATTITVASAANILMNGHVHDATTPSALPTPPSQITVTGIAGNVITLSAPVAGTTGVQIGDSIHFGPSRTTFATLANGGTAVTPGGTGVQYPPAIFTDLAGATGNRSRISGVQIAGAWNGINLYGTAGFYDDLEVGAFNIGFYIGEARDSCHLTNYHFWNFGFNAGQCLYSVYGDGNTFAAQLGQAGGIDGIYINTFMSSAGRFQINDPRTTFQITNMGIGDGGTCEILNCGFGTITNLTLPGHPIGSNPNWMLTHGGGTLQIVNLYLGSTRVPIMHTGGVLHITGSQFGSNGFPDQSALVQTGGQLFLDGNVISVNDTAFGAWTVPIIQINGGTVHMAGNQFNQRGPTPGTVPAIYIAVDNSNNYIVNNNLNGWGFPPPADGGDLGCYGPNSDGMQNRAIHTTHNIFGGAIWGSALLINAPGGTNRNLMWLSNNVNRWDFTGINTPETGANTGSDMWISRFDDAGNPIDTPIIITRSTGVVTLLHPPIMTNLPPNFANEGAAAGGGVPVGGVFRTGTALQVRTV